MRQMVRNKNTNRMKGILFIAGVLSAAIVLAVSLIYRLLKHFTFRQQKELGIDYGEAFEKRGEIG